MQKTCIDIGKFQKYNDIGKNYIEKQFHAACSSREFRELFAIEDKLMQKYLFVVAHPDDELLGAGATIRKMSNSGHEVYVCVLNSVSDIRCDDSGKMIREMHQSHKDLGVADAIIGNFPTMNFNITPHIDLVRFIENGIYQFQPDVIVTHHHCDLHNDHQMVSLACQAASRLSQRQVMKINPIKALYFMEIPSSTDWGTPCRNDGFRPDAYVEISKEDFAAKIVALQEYSDGDVLREPPHPRSTRSLEALATKRGSEIGCNLAEAFQTVYRKGLL